MGFFRRLLGREHPAAPPAHAIAPPPSPQGGIRYDPELVGHLLQDHALLGGIFSQIGDAARTGNLDELHRLLPLFKSRLEGHVLIENVRFYAYLEQSISGNRANMELMHDFRRDMNDIVRRVIAILKRHMDRKRHDPVAFAADYADLGELLERRLDSEESQLYPLYGPT